MRRIPTDALRPGEPIPTHPAPQDVGLDFWGWLREKATYKPLTARQKRVATWLAVAVILLVVVAFAGIITDGRMGLVGVVGGSMMQYLPQGSTVITFPLPPREGDFVVARAETPDNTEGVEVADTQSQLIVKQYEDGKLVSTDCNDTYSQFEYRGRVVACIPTQKLLWWRGRGYFTPSQVRSEEEQAEVDEATERRRQARAAAEKARGNLGDESLLLGPTETRPLGVELEVPKGSRRIAWNMASAPLYPEAIVVVVASGGQSVRQKVPPDNCRVKGGMMLPPGGRSVTMEAKNKDAAVMVEVSFYSH